jgi:tRNA(fMet)-specific endonuclease VapC
MMQIVVDTDVLSYLFKNNPTGLLYQSEVDGRSVSISFMTVAELELWAIQCHWGEHRLLRLRLYLGQFTVVESNPDLCLKWAEVMNAARATGHRIESADAWVAATALIHNFPLVTHNRKDYLGVPGLTLISHA